MIRILAIGDIFGKVGRMIIEKHLNNLKEENEIDLVIANVENVTHGKGVSYKHYKMLNDLGINVMTSGNHIFALPETREYIKQTIKLLRPLNSNPYHPGKGSLLLNLKNKKIRITNLIGQTFMPLAENPYFALENLLKNDDCDIHLLDFHAEATAEKNAFAYYFDGKITALWGTHTHVQTADEKILAKGTAFISDVGMTGPAEGIIGAQPAGIIQRVKYGYASPMKPLYQEKGQFNGLILEIDEKTNKVTFLKRVNFKSNLIF